MRALLPVLRAALLGAACLAAAVLPAGAATLHIECEDFIAAHDIFPEVPHGENGVLYGLDAPGEWTRYELPAGAAGRYTVLMRCWGDDGVTTRVRITLAQANADPQVMDVTYTGRGACGT